MDTTWILLTVWCGLIAPTFIASLWITRRST